MNLKSCDCCGVVIDMTKLIEPNFEFDDGSVNAGALRMGWW